MWSGGCYGFLYGGHIINSYVEKNNMDVKFLLAAEKDFEETVIYYIIRLERLKLKTIQSALQVSSTYTKNIWLTIYIVMV